MKKCLVILLLLTGTTYAKPEPGLNDYGKLLSSNMFSQHCIINDPGVSGSPVVDIYINEKINCIEIQSIYSNFYTQARKYLRALNYDLMQFAPVKTLHLRILTLAQLNNPDYFSETDKKCMYNPWCDSGAFYGRTFYSLDSSNINVYVVYTKSHVNWKFSFESTIKHELMHVILYRYHWNYLLLGKDEHKLIDNFLEWTRK